MRVKCCPRATPVGLRYGLDVFFLTHVRFELFHPACLPAARQGYEWLKFIHAHNVVRGRTGIEPPLPGTSEQQCRSNLAHRLPHAIDNHAPRRASRQVPSPSIHCFQHSLHTAEKTPVVSDMRMHTPAGHRAYMHTRMHMRQGANPAGTSIAAEFMLVGWNPATGPQSDAGMYFGISPSRFSKHLFRVFP